MLLLLLLLLMVLLALEPKYFGHLRNMQQVPTAKRIDHELLAPRRQCPILCGQGKGGTRYSHFRGVRAWWGGKERSYTKKGFPYF